MTAKRSIFEDVSTTEKSTPVPAGIDGAKKGDRRGIRIWLMVLFAMVLVMISVGGLTRLTDSGLSITEWRPVEGAIPPMNAAAWQSEFDKYKAIPEFQLQNSEMTLSDFKGIYWWEWGHRQIGRTIGLVWGIGFLFFWLTGRIPTGWTGRLVGVGALGGLQGAIGWWMVSSGLGGQMLDVASYRLAIHLALAFAILGLITWFILQLSRSEAQLLQARRVREGRLFGISTGLMHFVLLQVILGALVAGIDAGRTYTDWPLMAGGFFPPEPFSLSPVWRNFFEDPGLVQFIHRMSGYLLLAFAIVVWRRGRKSPVATTRRAFDWAMVMIMGQIVLGIGTVLYGAPWQIAIVHQLVAVVVWVLVIRARFQAGYPAAESIRRTA